MSIGANAASVSAYSSSPVQFAGAPGLITQTATNQQQALTGQGYNVDIVRAPGGPNTPSLLSSETIGPAPILNKISSTDKVTQKVVDAQNAGTLSIVLGCAALGTGTGFALPILFELLGKRRHFETKAFFEKIKDAATDIADGNKRGEKAKALNTLAADNFGTKVVDSLRGAAGFDADKLKNVQIELEPPSGGHDQKAAAQKFIGRGIHAADKTEVYRLRGQVIDALKTAATASGDRDVLSHITAQRRNFFGDANPASLDLTKAHKAWQGAELPHEFDTHKNFIHDVVDPIIRKAGIIYVGRG